MKKTIITTTAIFAMNFAFSQMSYNLPEGYHTFKNLNGKESRADGDFDGDGVSDLAIVCADKNETKIIVVYLASKWTIDQSYWWFPWNFSYNDLKFENNILKISSNEDEFGIVELRLKYYNEYNNMKLIGYAEKQFMRAEDGTGNMIVINSKSVNLNTNEYEVNGGAKKKINIDPVTLSNIEKYFDYLGKIGENEMRR